LNSSKHPDESPRLLEPESAKLKLRQPEWPFGISEQSQRKEIRHGKPESTKPSIDIGSPLGRLASIPGAPCGSRLSRELTAHRTDQTQKKPEVSEIPISEGGFEKKS